MPTNDAKPTTKPRRKILRWRRQPRETGLRSMVQGERGWDLMYGDDRIATVSGGGGDRWNPAGYYFYAGSDEKLGIPHANTSSKLVPTADEAKAACREHVERHLRRDDVR